MIDLQQKSGYGHEKSTNTTIALLTTGAIDPNNRSIWSGTAAAARDAGANLICYPGRLVRSPVEFEIQRNIIYQMVDARTIDGIVIMGGLNAWLSTEETYSFIQGLEPMPVVTTGIVLEGVPGVTVGNYRAMYDVVTHLVSVHHHQRIAFIRGQVNHQEALDRYRAYVDVLEEHHIPLDPELVYQGNFRESGGVEGIITLLDERKVSFDALVAASDNMAIGALKTLQARGFRVPADVAIAGLNGEDQGLVINPPLTTAPLHFYEQAYQATRMVLALMEGEEVPPKVILPARVVVRQSCGCSNPFVTHAEAIQHTERLDSFTDEILLLDSLIFGETNVQLKLPQDERIQQIFPALLKLFLTESQGKSEGVFLERFTEAVQHTGSSNDAFPRWHEILSTLRRFAISQLAETQARLRVENLVQQARVVVGETARQYNAYQVLQADEKQHILGEISQRLNVTTSIAELADALEFAFRLLNIPYGYLFLYEGSPDTSTGPSLAGKPGPNRLARFVFAYEDHHRVSLPLDGQPDSLLFPTCLLLPPGLLQKDRLHSLVVEPLFFRDDQLGYVVFEADPREETIYEILGGQISTSLKRTLLAERNIRLFDEAKEFDIVMIGAVEGPITDAYSYMDMELFAQAIYDALELVAHVMDCTGMFSAHNTRAFAEVSDTPLLFMGEDIAGTNGPIFSPKFVRTQGLPRWKWITEPVKAKGFKFLYHTDGRYGNFLPLIFDELGADGLNPIERNNCNDIFEIRQQYPDKLLFVNVCCIHTLPHCTLGDVEDETLELIEKIGPQGGIFIGSSSEVHDAVPVENAAQMYHTVHEYGTYPIDVERIQARRATLKKSGALKLWA